MLNADGRPLRVRDRARAEEPDGRESGALVDISFEGSTLIVNVSHVLTDGCGFVAILEHLVTRYLCRRWEDQPEPAQALAQPSPYDYADPLEALPDPRERFDFEYPDAVFFEAGDLDPDGIQYFALDCDERRIEDLAREAEGSFSGVLAGALGSALKLQSRIRDLVITCPMDMRGTLGCTRTLQNCNQSMHYVFPPAIWKYPFQQRLSMLKAQLYLQRSGEYCLPRFLEWRAQIRSLSAIPYSLQMMHRSYLQGIGRRADVMMLTVLNELFLSLVCALVLSLLLSEAGFWAAFILQEVLTLGALLLFVRWKNKEKRQLSRDGLLMLPAGYGVADEDRLSCRVSRQEDVMRFSEQVRQYCLRRQGNRRSAAILALCVEEIGISILRFGIRGRKKQCEILLYASNGAWTLRFRDDCDAFDPVSYLDSFKPAAPHDRFGLRLALSMAREAVYVRSMNINNLRIRVSAR